MNKTLLEIFGNMKVWEFLVVFSVACLIKGFLVAIHLKKGGEWTLANMGDCYKNVDLAYKLWKEQGWNPWVAYLSGSYLSKY